MYSGASGVRDRRQRQAKDLIHADDSSRVDLGIEFWNSFALECICLSEILHGTENSPIMSGNLALA